MLPHPHFNFLFFLGGNHVQKWEHRNPTGVRGQSIHGQTGNQLPYSVTMPCPDIQCSSHQPSSLVSNMLDTALACLSHSPVSFPRPLTGLPILRSKPGSRGDRPRSHSVSDSCQVHLPWQIKPRLLVTSSHASSLPISPSRPRTKGHRLWGLTCTGYQEAAEPSDNCRKG